MRRTAHDMFALALGALALSAGCAAVSSPFPAPLCARADRATGAAAAAAGPPWPSLNYAVAAALPEPPGGVDALVALSASEAVAALCSRRVRAVHYAAALLKRAAAYECVNAWAALDPGRVLAEAAAVDALADAGADVRPLCGLPVGLKDFLDAEGYPTTAGTPALEAHYPTVESLLVTRVKAAHGVVLGKLRMHELGCGDTTLNPVYGPTLNPHALTHTVGGSSGGNGAALAARAAVLAICGDSGGSCRTPAAATGTVGFRPSTGCYQPGVGAVRMASFRDTAGVSARSVADVALLNAVLSDCAADVAPRRIATLRIGVPAYFWRDVAVESLAVLQPALATLRAAGATLVPIDAPSDALMASFLSGMGDALFYAQELPRDIAMYLATHNYSTSLHSLVTAAATPSVRSWLRSFLQSPSAGDASAYYDALERGVPELRAAWARLFDDADVDVLALPTTPIPARPIADVEPMVDLNGQRAFYYDVIGKAMMADAVAGLPSISLPAGVTAAHGPYPAGLPVGLMLYGRRRADAALLAAAAAVETALGASAQPPAPPPVPACAGCTARLGWSKVAYPAELLPAADASGSGAMGYSPDSYALGFDGQCALKAQLAQAGVALPLQSPHATGEAVDWGRRQEGATPAPPPAGDHVCDVRAATHTEL